MRTSSTAALAFAVLLAGCGQPAATDPFAESGAQADRIECAVAGAAEPERVCAIERTQGAGGLLLTIRHPDGGFRRLQVTRDGRGVVSADGAEPAVVSVAGGDRIEVAVAGDRYLLPATVKGADATGR